MKARLLPTDGSDPIDIADALSLVGRGDECDVPIADVSISKRHCLIAITDDLLLIRDLASTNGCRINGHRVRYGAVLPGDRLTIGAVELRVEIPRDRELVPRPASEDTTDV